MEMRGYILGGAKGMLSILGVFRLAPPWTITGVLIGVGSESGAGISLVTFDCILTDFGEAILLGVCLAGVCNIGFLTVFLVMISLSHWVT